MLNGIDVIKVRIGHCLENAHVPSEKVVVQHARWQLLEQPFGSRLIARPPGGLRQEERILPQPNDLLGLTDLSPVPGIPVKQQDVHSLDAINVCNPLIECGGIEVVGPSPTGAVGAARRRMDEGIQSGKDAVPNHIGRSSRAAWTSAATLTPW